MLPYNPFRKIQVPTSLGYMQMYTVTIPAGMGTSIQNLTAEDGDIFEGSTFGSSDFSQESQTFAPLLSDFVIHGKGRDYLVKVSGTSSYKNYTLYGGPNSSYPSIGVIGGVRSSYFTCPMFIYVTDSDAWAYSNKTVYISGATQNPPNFSLTQTQTDGTNLGYYVQAYVRDVGGIGVVAMGVVAKDNNADIAIRDILGNARMPGGGDPYDDLPIGGDEPLPDGDSIPEPGFPLLSAASTGIVGLFCPSVAQMQQLADFMWTDFGGHGTTVTEVLEEIVEALKRTISNPLDYIFGLNMIPSQGLSIGASKVVKFGFVSSGVYMPILADHYFRVDCGSLSFDTLCGNSFLDYAPYSKFSIYLPYIGFKDLDPNDLVGHTISVVYHGDAITGGLTAYVFKDGNVMYQYSGGCALNIPLSSDNWGATIAAAASVATGVISAAAVPGAAGVAGAGKALLKGAASNVASNPSLLSPQVMHSGAVTGSPGFMGMQYPFIIREAVNFHSTAGFNKSSGYPAYYYRKLGDVTGYTTVMDAHMANIPMATQEEIQEIEELLESGVIL